LTRLLPQDKTRNASGMRRSVHNTDTSTPPVSSENQPIPALLKKWLTDYAATGLPPAYLIKEEGSIE
jgi:hypothetical protein